ncbi:MAG: hypothetical protein F6K14_15575 [Symploca sp. SIO2C1]|nr:hypothetical protein [Symploca sp. SIO2C1]
MEAGTAPIRFWLRVIESVAPSERRSSDTLNYYTPSVSPVATILKNNQLFVKSEGLHILPHISLKWGVGTG